LLIGLIAMLVVYRTLPRRPEGWIIALAVGLLGGWLGGWLADLVGLKSVNWLGSVLVAFVGSVIILWLLRRALPGRP